MAGDRDLDAFRKEYGLDGAFREAVKRWRETKHHQASAIGTRGPVVTALVERFRRDLEDHLVRHHQADRQLSRAWREVKRPRRGTKRAAALKRNARERRRDKAWQAFEHASECLALLSPWYVHADDELNAEFNAIKIARDGIDDAIAKLLALDDKLQREGHVAWYRRHTAGQRGVEEPPDGDPRAFLAEARRGRDPVVALLVARQIIAWIPTLSNRSSTKGGRPGKPGRKRLVQALGDAGVDDATVQDVLLELGFDEVEAGRDNIRATRSAAKKSKG